VSGAGLMMIGGLPRPTARGVGWCSPGGRRVSGEQFAFIFDRAALTGTGSGGGLGWGDPKPFTLGLLDEALRCTRDLAARVKGSDARSQWPVIDAAPALGRLTGLTGKDEVIWLRACLAACIPPTRGPEDGHAD
jgi:hypothetical protein